MNLLAFDTSTDQMSVAVARGTGAGQQVWQHTGAGGAQASTGLIAAVLELMGAAQLHLAQLDAICFGSGPGSFTGLRTACAVAQGLAFGANVAVLPVNSLLAVAEAARYGAHQGATRVTLSALLDARMDEIYAASFTWIDNQWHALDAAQLLNPQTVQAYAQSHGAHGLAGNVFAVYQDRLSVTPGLPWQAALPEASAMLRLAPQLLRQGQAVAAAHALPTYVRDKVALTTAERTALKAAQAAVA